MSSRTIQGSPGYQKHSISPRLCYYRPHSTGGEMSFAWEVSRSMDRRPRSLNPKFFYNRAGSLLFDQICQLPEYYPTRTEIKILQRMQDELTGHLHHNYRLVELGSGSAIKTRLILDVLDGMQDGVEFLPIDVSEILGESSLDLLEAYPRLRITGVMDTFESGLEFVRRYGGGPNLIAFLGSSLGNFEPHDAQEFLRQVSSTMDTSDLFLIGLDLVKERGVLERAYNDSRGITARFNLNVLLRINEELDGNFVPDNFEHHCIFNPDRSRIEMYLRSTKRQSVSIPKSGLSLDLEENELIHTEYSHKYTVPGIRSMMRGAGLEICRTWHDARGYCVVLASRRPGRTGIRRRATAHPA